MNATDNNNPMPSAKSAFYPTFFLCLFLGSFGAHRFYTGKIKSGIAQLVTLGVCGIWPLVDLVTILIGRFKDKWGAPIPNSSPKLTWAITIGVCVLGLAAMLGTQATPDSTAANTDMKEKADTASNSPHLNKNDEKLTSLDGKSYRGDAAAKNILGALMTGYYVAKFERDAKGYLQCKLTLRLHDSNHGWGQPRTETVPVRWESRNPDYACIAKGSDLFDELGVVPGKISKESAPSTIALEDNDLNCITLSRQ